MLVILIIFNVLHLAVEWALLAGVLSAFVLLFPYGGNLKTWLATFNKGAGNTCGVILNVSLVVGFAGVMKASALFPELVNWIGSIQMPGLVFVAVTTATCAAASASSAGGMGVAMSTFAQTYINMGVNLEAAHRVAAIRILDTRHPFRTPADRLPCSASAIRRIRTLSRTSSSRRRSYRSYASSALSHGT